MPRHTRHASKTRYRECEEVDEVTFAQLMERRHIEPTGRTSTGRRVWRV